MLLGRNNTGQVGDGSLEDKLVPTPVASTAGGEVVVFASLEAGGGHTCGLTSTGKAYCWGVNNFGQLGDGTTADRSTPTAVTGPGGGSALAFAGLATGGTHTCGRTTGGLIYCWGWNHLGQLGDGTATDETTPHLVSVPGISPTITSLVIDPTTIPIESFAGYTASISNPGPTLSDVFVQAWVVQGTTKRAAGGTNLNCSGQFDGQLPASCTLSYTALVSNGSQGSGTLVAGGAMFQIDLFSGATTYDSKSIPITLQ